MEVEKEIEKGKLKLKEKFSNWFKSPYNKIFLFILVATFIIRLIIFLKTSQQPLWWDEADYLATGKKWGLGLNIEDIWYYRRGFFFPLFSSFFFKLGLGEVTIRFSMLLFSTAFVLVSYLIIKKMFNEKYALLASLGISLSWIVLFFTGRILTDIPAAFFLLLTLLFFWDGYILKKGNKYLYLSVISFALAVLTRMQSLMLAPPFLIIIFLKEKFGMLKNKRLWISLLIFFIILSPHIYIYYKHFGNPLKDITSHYLGIGSDVVEGNKRTLSMATFNYLKDLPYMLSKPIFYLLVIGIFFFFFNLILGFDKIFDSDNLQTKFFVLSWILSLFLIMGYIGSVSYVEQRYITSGLPFLFMIASIPLIKLSEYFVRKFKIKEFSSIILISILLLILLSINILGVSNFNWTFDLTENKKLSYLEVKQAGLWIKENSNQEDVIISQSRPQIVYYAERTTYTIDSLGKNESSFEENLTKIKPRYLVLSIFEAHEQWIYEYPQKHNNTLTPIQAYYQQQQPVLVIYEFKRYA